MKRRLNALAIASDAISFVLRAPRFGYLLNRCNLRNLRIYFDEL